MKQGGGVVYFPAGVYAFNDMIRLESHVIIRGATPNGMRTARDGEYKPPARFKFPKYVPKCEGDGSPKESAFKGIELKEPNKTTHCGVINIDIAARPHQVRLRRLQAG